MINIGYHGLDRMKQETTQSYIKNLSVPLLAKILSYLDFDAIRIFFNESCINSLQDFRMAKQKTGNVSHSGKINMRGPRLSQIQKF